MRLGWLTDPHLNFVSSAEVLALGKKIASKNVDALVITGDIAEAQNLHDCLEVLHEGLQKVIYFVLGNHDTYNSSIAATMVSAGSFKNPDIRYLTKLNEPIELTPNCALVGNDGWYDGRNGDLLNSKVLVGDMEATKEIREAYLQGGGLRGPVVLKRRLEILGDAARDRTRPKIKKALEEYEKVIFATHFPPYAGAAWHRGKPSDHHWLPYFSSKCMGEMLTEEFTKHEGKRLLVLCGHSHSPGVIEPVPNLVVMTGGARYRHPHLNRVVTIEAGMTVTRPG